MRKFLVIALSVGAMSNKIFKSGDIVSEDAFPEGQADNLVEQGFLEEYKEDTQSHILTDADFKANPDLDFETLKVGDEIFLPKTGFTPAEENESDTEAKGGTKKTTAKK